MAIGYVTLEGVWASFTDKPMVPGVSDVVQDVYPNILRFLGFAFLLAVFLLIAWPSIRGRRATAQPPGEAPLTESEAEQEWRDQRNQIDDLELTLERLEQEATLATERAVAGEAKRETQRREFEQFEEATVAARIAAKDELRKEREEHVADRRVLSDDLDAANERIAQLTSRYEPEQKWEAVDNELVMSLNTHGIPAFKELHHIVENTMQPLSSGTGIARWVPKLYADGWGWEIGKALRELEKRLEHGDNGEPFVSVWESFHVRYVRLMFWADVLKEDPGFGMDVLSETLPKWAGMHDKYIERIVLLGNGIGRPAVKHTLENHGTGRDVRARLVPA